MKKAKNRLLSLTLCALVAITSMFTVVGCTPGGGGGGNVVNDDMSQLYVATYGGGYGTEFLKDLKDRFEKYAAEMHFEKGKTGAQIQYIQDKDKYTANALKDKIAYDSNEVFFITGDALNDFLKNDSILDITDIITAPLSDFNETKSIADKIRPEMNLHHNVDGKYYSIPFVDGGTGLIYNVDVFETRQLYFAKNGAPSERLQDGGSFTKYSYVGATGDKSAGPDGAYGTTDDGLPATLAEFNELLTRMKKTSVDSLIWSGQYEDAYTPFLANAFAANYHGLNEMATLSDAGGAQGRNHRLITSFSNGEPVIEEKKITVDNVLELAKSAGYYYGLKMFEMIVDSGTISKYSWQDLSHTRAQEQFLYSIWDDEPIAFLLDGCWWENEADSAGTFDRLVSDIGEEAGRSETRFGYFPMPWASEDQIGSKYTMSGGGGSVIVTKTFPKEKLDLLKCFLQFAFTDESLQRMTINIGLPAPYVYDMGDKNNPTSYYNKMSYFTKDFWERQKSSDIVYGFISDDLKYNNDVINVNEVLKHTSSYTKGGARFSYFPTECYYNNVGAIDYFEGMFRRVNTK